MKQLRGVGVASLVGMMLLTGWDNYAQAQHVSTELATLAEEQKPSFKPTLYLSHRRCMVDGKTISIN